MPLLATRHELRGNALAPLLLHHIESTLLAAGVTKVIMPALPLTEGPIPEAPLPPGQFGTTLGQLGNGPVSSGPGLNSWGSLVGYRPPSPGALLEACKSPMLQLPGTPYLMKHLSSETLTKVTCAKPSHVCTPCPGLLLLTIAPNSDAGFCDVM